MLLPIRKSYFIILFVIVASSLFAKDNPSAKVVFPNLEKKRGMLSLIVESYASKNVKFTSQLAEKAELWLGDICLAKLTKASSDVVSEKRRRIFPFPAIKLAPGYYFVTVRLYKKGWVSGRSKWKGETFQIGIHPGKICKIYKKIPFLLW